MADDGAADPAGDLAASCVAWGWPIWDAGERAGWSTSCTTRQPTSVHRRLRHGMRAWTKAPSTSISSRRQGAPMAGASRLAGCMALGVVGIGLVVRLRRSITYRVLDPADAERAVPRRASLPAAQVVLRRALQRPAGAARPGRRPLVPRRSTRTSSTASSTARPGAPSDVSRWSGRFDNGIVDGLVNLIGRRVLRDRQLAAQRADRLSSAATCCSWSWRRSACGCCFVCLGGDVVRQRFAAGAASVSVRRVATRATT